VTVPSFPRRFVEASAARRAYGDQVDRVGTFLSRGDVLADAVVETFAHMLPGQGTRLVDRALKEGIDTVKNAPAPLRDFFAEVDRVPAWVDPRAIERGGELLFRAGFFGGVVLGVSLLYGYASPGGNKPLVFSGQLADQAPRRLAETSRFVLATCSAGGLHRQSEGFAITVKVRLMHAQVRRMILASGRWDGETWGLPINQHDMAGTSILFSYAPIESLRALGFVFDEEEVHLYMQLWRYSGYLIGLDPDIAPASEYDARRLKDIIRATEGEPDEDGRRLAAAMFRAGPRSHGKNLEERRRGERDSQVGEGLVRAIMGDELSDKLAVPKTHYRHAIHPLRAVLSRVEQNPYLKSALRGRSIKVGRRYWRIAVSRGVDHDAFGLPSQLLGISKRGKAA
jgi:hypothetical protein